MLKELKLVNSFIDFCQPRICLIHLIFHESVNCELDDLEKELYQKLIDKFTIHALFHSLSTTNKPRKSLTKK